MCRFSGPVISVANTRIYARHHGDAQTLIYEMRVHSAADNAMILPVPTPVGSRADALTWIDLSDNPDMLRMLDRATAPVPRSAARGLRSRSAPAPLPVVQVGSFEASFVPSLADFDRLDARFRLGPGLRSSLARQADWGFAVFQLVAGDSKVHPMGMRFPTRLRDRCYFPTIHVHEGVEPVLATFDHVLLGQGWFDIERTVADNAIDFACIEHRLHGGSKFAPLALRQAHEAGIINLDAPIYRVDLGGVARNADVFLLSPS